MKKNVLRMVAAALALAVTLSGCAVDLEGFVNRLRWAIGGSAFPSDHAPPGAALPETAYADMVYTRPDAEAVEDALDTVRTLAEKGDDLDALIDAVYVLYDAYDSFYTNYNLSYLRYCHELTDEEWAAEYSYCAAGAAQADAALDNMYYALADSPLRAELEDEEYFGPGFFDAYEGESIWDDGFLELMEQEAALVDRYYELSSQAVELDPYSQEFFDTAGAEMEALFVDLAALRQQIAAYTGYDSYPQFAYDFYYARDYTPEDAAVYLEGVKDTLSPLYVRLLSLEDVWEPLWTAARQSQTYAYVRDCAQAMGGTVEEAFSLLDRAGLYDMEYSENKYNASFELFLTSYGEPFIFMNPTGARADSLTLVHEFGHFSNDYACGGSYAGIDAAEVYSQGMEYLSLFYAPGGGDLERYKLADGLCTYVEQSAFAAFEQQVYALAGEDLTAENIRAIYSQVSMDYGLASGGIDGRSYVNITHFFTSPLYVISYVVSNDAAFQLYQLEKQTAGAGLEIYEKSLSSEEGYFLAFLDECGLEYPFDAGRLDRVRQSLEEALWD